jgi:hypothetical protein
MSQYPHIFRVRQSFQAPTVPVDRIPANPRQIPFGLATTQHDVT